MVSLLTLSLEGMAFAIYWPGLWGLLLVLAGAAAFARRYRPDAIRHRNLAELLLPFVFPVAIVAWAHALYAALEGQPQGWHWQDIGMFGFLVLQGAAGVWMIVRHRARLAVALCICAAAACWAVGACFVGAMSIHNAWL